MLVLDKDLVCWLLLVLQLRYDFLLFNPVHYEIFYSTDFPKYMKEETRYWNTYNLYLLHYVEGQGVLEYTVKHFFLNIV